MINNWKNKTPKALIIEDCLHSVFATRNILLEGGYSVVSSCGEQGVKVAMEENPNIILLEILLKKRNGLQILNQLKTNGFTKHIPVLIVTKINSQNYWDESYLLGADGYLVKPNHYPWLLTRANKVIQLI